MVVRTLKNLHTKNFQILKLLILQRQLTLECNNDHDSQSNEI